MRHRIDWPVAWAVAAGSVAALLTSFVLVRTLGG